MDVPDLTGAPPFPQVEPWVQLRLENTVVLYNDKEDRIRYEAVIYSPLSAILHATFPNSRNFLVKPQSTLRRTVKMDDAINQADAERMKALLARLSLDSYESFVPGRDEGSETHLYPDFIIAKATHELHQDRIICIVEVKRDDANEWDSRLQLIQYLGIAARKARRAPLLTGFLVMGNRVLVYKVEGEGVTKATFVVELATADIRFRRSLHDIAVRNWSMAAL